MRGIANVSVVVLATAVVVAGGVAGASAAGIPKGYQVVAKSGYAAAGFSQASGTAKCPTGTVVLGGGVLIVSDAVVADVNSSWPTNNRTWKAVVNDGVAVPTDFTVYAICAHKPTGYQQVTTPSLDNPAGDQTGVFAMCPVGKKVFGGGAVSDSTSTAVTQASSLPGKFAGPPTQYAWLGVMNNGSASDEHFNVVAICGKLPGWALQVSGGTADAGALSPQASLTCPAGDVPLGGGANVASGDVHIGINTTEPSSNGWIVYVGNDSLQDVTFRTAVVCVS